ncbi:hypothetical protein BDZ89DRAFT_991784 [Hymenopellis radicata]|nr:hypothetical protein BDZ89DRAFT_991784 [Hymenopellis radicata]
MGLQETASRRIADAKRIFHPMRSLPQDILTEIFLSCTPSVDHHNFDWSRRGTNFDSLCPLNHPWNISHVSHRWREISLSLPRLWSVIYLDFTRYTSFSPRQCSFVGSLLFERSAKLDLCVNIVSGEMGIGYHPLMPLLKESTTRWRILNARMSSPSLQSLSGCEFPLLQELGVRDEEPGNEPDVPVDTFRNVQNVRIMHLYPSDTGEDAYKTLGEFAWSKLSKLSCYFSELESDFLPSLQQLTSIEEFTMTIDFITTSFLEDLSGRLITLPALKRLEVTNDRKAHEIEMFLHILRIPSIFCLTVNFATPVYYMAFVPHPDFHRLSSLRITCSMTEPSSQLDYMGGTGTRMLLNFLRPMSGVEEFRLKDKIVTSEFLDGLVERGAEKGAVLLPSLTILDLHECGFADHDEALDSIRRIVESHSLNRLCPPLERIILPHEDWLNEFIVDRVEVVRLDRSYVVED